MGADRRTGPVGSSPGGGGLWGPEGEVAEAAQPIETQVLEVRPMASHDGRVSWIERELGAEIRTVYDDQRPGWLRERSQCRDGVKHGLRETYSGHGDVIERWHYVSGREHGPYQRLSGLQIDGAFIDGRRSGRWFYRRPEERSLAAEVDHRDGTVSTWRSYSAAGGPAAHR
jgi:hypothetical protein